MAAIGSDPVPSTPAAACKALEEHLPKVLRGKTLVEVGWEHPDPLTLLIPLKGIRVTGESEPYLLRLHFGYYPEWPPSALFVNPDTKQYNYPDDMPWLPIINGSPEIAVHAKYDPIGQLICSSVTLEFYLIRHSVNPEHLWNPARQNFAATINAVKHGLCPPYYQGPQQPRHQNEK